MREIFFFFALINSQRLKPSFNSLLHLWLLQKPQISQICARTLCLLFSFSMHALYPTLESPLYPFIILSFFFSFFRQFVVLTPCHEFVFGVPNSQVIPLTLFLMEDFEKCLSFTHYQDLPFFLRNFFLLFCTLFFMSYIFTH